MKLFNLLFCFLFYLSTYAQSYYQVVAKDSLNMRDSASVNSSLIDKLGTGEFVELLEKTKRSEIISSNNRSEKGYWYKVQTSKNKIGYVFSIYLLEKQVNPNEYVGCENNLPCNSVFNFRQFDAKIFNYQTQEHPTYKKDSIFVYEFVFNNIGDKLIQIIPKEQSDSVVLSYTLIEHITEQFNFRLHPEKDAFEKWRKNMVSWVGHQPYKELTNHNNCFQVPTINLEEIEELRQDQFNLKDTLVDLSGESWNVATLIYKDKPATFVITQVVFKIELYRAGKKYTEQYLDIELSYGC